ncbi:LacI family transcriptional regulator [Brachybacterium sp. p3-SID1565]|uniref:LacI family DNA-binding transcriptional regulator n=1 Tax=Brachybacterium epidermidis TaxID=2781983 RepID=A0ABR9W1I7_9MICO|nr:MULTISPECIES: LacI family DNA-binding transcriptional regulator [Brachybacterium]MBE9403998.1 LacI family DNA-binding transcriptional regulator [Brachybacterium epidermidis]MCT1385683.1 LacI family transcriptional regulator [Brachybacterium sp. p3-SID1565]
MSNDASSPSHDIIDPAADGSSPDGGGPAGIDGSTGQVVEQEDKVAGSIAQDEGPTRGTLRDVADSLGISSAVALRALRGTDDIRPLMATRVREAAERLNFPLEELADEDSHHGVVAVLVNTMRNTWISDLVRAIRIELTATGRSAVVVPTRRRVPEYPVAADTEAIESLVRLGVDGFLMISDLADMDSVLEATGDRPFVGIGCSRDFVGRFDTVRIDDEVGQGLLVDHLVGLGHTEIAHVGGVGAEVARERADGFRKAMERHGLSETARVEPGDFTEQVGHTAGSMLLRGSRVPTAITCANDLTAIGVLSAAREAGYEVPEQLAVAGYGNTSLAASGIAQLTSVDPNSDRLGALAAQFLVDRVSGHVGPARDVAVAPSIVVRRSSSAGPRPAQERRKRISVD